MSATAQAFGIGMVLGIVLFFVMVWLGWIDKFLHSIEKRFK